MYRIVINTKVLKFRDWESVVKFCKQKKSKQANYFKLFDEVSAVYSIIQAIYTKGNPTLYINNDKLIPTSSFKCKACGWLLRNDYKDEGNFKNTETCWYCATREGEGVRNLFFAKWEIKELKSKIRKLNRTIKKLEAK